MECGADSEFEVRPHAAPTIRDAPTSLFNVTAARPRLIVLAALALAAGAATPASADLVFLSSGRSLSVKAVRYEDEDAVLTLRAGGEIVCSRASIARVEPDEVPYPEPVAEALTSPVAPAPAGPARAARAAPIPAEYRALVGTLARNHGVDEKLVHAVVAVESAWQPRARSRKGARGLMQLMPATARQYGVRNAYVPAANLDAGIKHLRSLLDRFEVSLALAAYNAGEATVRRFGGIPPYRETREYVSRVLELAGAAAPAAAAAVASVTPEP
jgi:soluble lytic murein transglycosylase-like protein